MTRTRFLSYKRDTVLQHSRSSGSYRLDSFRSQRREVKEETGVDTEFVEAIAFRPLSTQISVDDHEIRAAKWMPLVEFVKQPLIKGDGLFKKIIDVCLARLRRRYCGLFPHQVATKFDGKESTLYYNVLQAEYDSNCGTSRS